MVLFGKCVQEATGGIRSSSKKIFWQENYWLGPLQLRPLWKSGNPFCDKAKQLPVSPIGPFVSSKCRKVFNVSPMEVRINDAPCYLITPEPPLRPQILFNSLMAQNTGKVHEINVTLCRFYCCFVLGLLKFTHTRIMVRVEGGEGIPDCLCCTASAGCCYIKATKLSRKLDRLSGNPSLQGRTT